MNLKEYQLAAARTCPDLGSLESNMRHMNLGVITEIGEILDVFKKNLAYKKDIDYVNLGEEFADASWYLVNEARFCDFPLKDIELKDYFKDADPITEDITDWLWVYLNGDLNTFEMIEWLANIAHGIGIDYFDSLDKNIAKLKARFPDKFDQDKAINRDIVTERAILEGRSGSFGVIV